MVTPEIRQWDRAVRARRLAEEFEHGVIVQALPVGSTVTWRLNNSFRVTEVLRHSGDRVKVRSRTSDREYWCYASTIRSGLIEVETPQEKPK